MKVTLVAATDGAGGADRAAMRLLDALGESGSNVTGLVRRKGSDRSGVHEVSPGVDRIVGPIRARTDRLIARCHRPDDDGFRSVNVWPTRLAQRLDSDVVNLHWVGSGAMSVADIGRIRQPTVMTLHDMWAFVGASHYASTDDDAPWRAAVCRRTSRLEPLAHRDLDEWSRRRKMRAWPIMTAIAPSRWIAELARNSEIMGNWPMRVIPNPLDISVFRPIERRAARNSVGVEEGRPLIAFGALDATSDRRKGFDLLREAVAKLDLADASAVVFGESEPKDASRFEIPIRWMGRVADDRVLASVYSAADVVVVPSRVDNLPQVAVEAQSCGTPVVGFQTGGLPDCVEDGVTGALADPFDTASLATHIAGLLADEPRRTSMGLAARRRAEAIWRPAVVAKQYLEVFAQAVDRAGPGSTIGG